MKVPYGWLRELCPTSLSPEEVAAALTGRGIEVDDVRYPWAAVTGVRVARVLDVRDHPGADKLCLATIDTGEGEREVVVGVRNMAPGDLVPHAAPGATLPGFDRPLERRTIRGQVSEGMLCSPKELGISGDHGGILILPSDLEPGMDLARSIGLDDAVIDIEVFPNRPDLLSVLGVARELAAATGDDLHPPDLSVPEAEEEKAGDAAWVEVRDPARCPRYVARVIRGVRHVASPLVAQVRLTAAGMRPLSAVVDATNYVLLELGHPMHPFDLARLAGGGVVVRTAGEGETLRTLDEVERRLSPEDLVIADREKAVGVAGVMGSAAAEVGEGTTDVLLESAWFEPLGILRTARRLGLRTEASVRFERGADPEVPADAAARAARLMVEWAGGIVLAGTVDVGETPPRRTVEVRPRRASLLLGEPLGGAEVREALGRLRLLSREEGDRVQVEVPGWRVDLAREVDVIEEVARVRGYDRLGSALPGVRRAGGLDHRQRLQRRLRDALVRAGLFEVTLPTFVSPAVLDVFEDDRREGIPLRNPVSAEEDRLRTALLPGLLGVARRNAAHRNGSVRLFEIGHVFRTSPLEEEHLAVVLAGDASIGWPSEHRPHDFLDAKGILEHLCEVLGVPRPSLGPPAPLPYHPGRSSMVEVGGRPVGEVGEIHPGVATSFDLSGRVAALELRVDGLLEAAEAAPMYEEVSRFPAVHRDLAFVVGARTPAGRVETILRETSGELLDRVALFDVFEGDPVPAGKRSLAFSLDLRARDRTLTDEEVERVVAAIAERLRAEVGAELRTG
ncbi:MAG TPA: phenylalanine--tRNA ligase subunit beta [Actinomycetota bacterium]|nr:phenylalanine--tRNA ligase subunit beta [Actinomycetota bacterium]